MCTAFSCIVLKNREVVWKFGIDSHEDLLKLRPGLSDHTDIPDNMKFARCEYSPKNNSYLHPDKWIFKLDGAIIPTWFDEICERNVKEAWKKWKEQLDSVLVRKKIINPFKIDPPIKVTSEHISLLRSWAYVRDSVWDSVGDSVGDSIGDSIWNSIRDSVWHSIGDSVRDSIRDSVGDSVWDSIGNSAWYSVGDLREYSMCDSLIAYVGSFFNLPRNQWKYTEKIKTNEYPFLPTVKLWEMGLVPVFNEEYWRLLGGKNAKVLWSGKIE